jgi:hypothetical protein
MFETPLLAWFDSDLYEQPLTSVYFDFMAALFLAKSRAALTE